MAPTSRLWSIPPEFHAKMEKKKPIPVCKICKTVFKLGIMSKEDFRRLQVSGCSYKPPILALTTLDRNLFKKK
jgi:hypothetical protein